MTDADDADILKDLTPFMVSDLAAHYPYKAPPPTPPPIAVPPLVIKPKHIMTDPLYEIFRTLRDGSDAVVQWRATLAGMKTPERAFHERREKMEFIDKLRAAKRELFKGEAKIATLAEVEADLAVNPRIGLPTFITLCRLENVQPFTIIYRETYYDFVWGETDPVNEGDSLIVELFAVNTTMPIVIYDPAAAAWHYREWDEITLLKFKETAALHIENIGKPYKAQSTYRVDELRVLYRCLRGGGGASEEAVKMPKPQLYEFIKQYFGGLVA